MYIDLIDPFTKKAKMTAGRVKPNGKRKHEVRIATSAESTR